jgi:NAD(P)-dependent dehydrogenase (short-subunit alcohol dehydrogenase family)
MDRAMQHYEGKTAVITGAASGIGRALVDKCIDEGMNVVLADVEVPALDAAVASLTHVQERLIAVATDVSDPDAVDALADAAFNRFGAVHVLFNNAGVGAGGTVWESTLADWTWVMGVNLWSVIHGVRSFVPRMIAQDEPGYIVNTASIAGLVKAHHSAPYGITKHGVVAITEQLSVEFERTGAKLKAAALCPSWVNTRINEAGRNRPDTLANPSADAAPTPEMQRRWAEMREVVRTATPAAVIADFVFDGMRAGKLYLLPHPESKAWVERRFYGIMEDY